MEMTLDVKKTTRSNFGGWGWSMVLFSLLMYYNFAAWTADGLNVFTPAFAKAHGWDPAVLLSFSTPGSWIGVLGALVFGDMVVRKGPRFVAVIGLIAGGAVTIWFGNVQSVFAYGVAIALTNFFATGYGFVVPGTLMNSWFPNKKGMALGWATMGMPVCTATFVPLMKFLFDSFGISASMTWVGGLLIGVGVLAVFWVKDSPERVGVYPDNDPTNHANIQETLKRMAAYKSPFTFKVLLKDRDMWLISLGYGCLWMVTIGIVSQYVLRLVSIGYPEEFAIKMLSSAAVFCLIGSYFWGWLDQKLGTKRASMFYAASYIVTLCCMLIRGGVVFTFITSIAVGSGLAGIKCLITSMTGSVYGRYDFPAANRLITTIANVIRACPFLLMGIVLKVTGGYTMSYVIFIFIDLVGLFLISRITNTCKGTQVLEEVREPSMIPLEEALSE